MEDIFKRSITSIILLVILFLALEFKFVLMFCLMLIFFQLTSEFYDLFKKIYQSKNKILFLALLFTIIYLLFFIIVVGLTLHDNFIEKKLYLYLIITICVSTDIGGYVFGKIFKGKKLTKLSPRKTYSGMIGSFILSFLSVLLFFKNFYDLYFLIVFSLFISSISQIGDIFISFLKRKAKIKDSSSILPGHGGLLDRFDGLIFAIPIGTIIINIL